jgi:hypothetical protein
MTVTRRARVALAGITCGALVLSIGIAWLAQIPPPSYFEGDQKFYRAMSRAPFTESPETRRPPYCWRVLPSLIARAVGGEDVGFRVLTTGSLAFLPLAVFWLCRSTEASERASLTAAALTSLAPPIMGLLSWDPIRPDALATLLVAVVAACFVSGKDLLAALVMAALALTKETSLVVVAFVLPWGIGVDRRRLRSAVRLTVLAVGLFVGLRWAIRPVGSYSLPGEFRHLYLPWSVTTIARRILFATASTWNLLLLASVASWLRDQRRALALALACPVFVATAQILVSMDVMRVVAAGWPFVAVAVARDVDRRSRGQQLALASVLCAAQVPWLLEYGRVVHVPLRGVEIVIFLASCGIVTIQWGGGSRSASDLIGRSGVR